MKLKRQIESAGGWFVGEYTALILSKFNEIENDKCSVGSSRTPQMGTVPPSVKVLKRLI